MERTIQEIQARLENTMEEGMLRPGDIPELSLYVDQILTLFEDKFTQKAQGEKPLTKSMVNNYTKEKLILPVQGKKYSRCQVLQLLCIFHLKNTLSIGEIKQVMTALMAEDCTGRQLEQLLESAPKARSRGQKITEEIVKSLEERQSGPLSTVEAAGLLLELAELSAALKSAAQSLAEYCFAPQE